MGDDDTELDRLYRRLALLPMEQRAVLLLHRLDDMSYAEIGWRLGIDIKAVERHFARAIYVIAFGPNGDG